MEKIADSALKPVSYTHLGKACCAELTNAQDAYEWSFVAVPAQPRAGVLKRCGGEENGTLKALVKRRGSRANQKELETLEQQAALGKRYLSELRGEVKRLVLVCEQEEMCIRDRVCSKRMAPVATTMSPDLTERSMPPQVPVRIKVSAPSWCSSSMAMAAEGDVYKRQQQCRLGRQ